MLIPLSVTAQRKNGTPDRFKAFKIAFLSDKLDLTEVEAEKFWPVYNAFDKKMHTYRLKGDFKLNKKLREIGGIDALSEKEAKDIIVKININEQNIFKAKQAFQQKLITILPFKKIIQLKMAEQEFKRKLLRKLREKRKMRKDY